MKRAASVSLLPTLASLMRRAQLRVTLATLLAVASVLTVTMLASLRVSQLHNLDLVAKSLAYTAEAAIVFRDSEAVEEQLRESLQREGLVQASVVMVADGQLLADQRRASRYPWWEYVFDGLLPLRAEAPVRFQQRELARVVLRGDVAPLLGALGWAGLAVVLGSVIGAGFTWQTARRMTSQVEQPLRDLARQSRRIRQRRAFVERVQGAGVREVAELAADFNELLAEVARREAELIEQHDHLQSDHLNLQQQARRDVLTGLSNRAHFEQCLQAAIARAQRVSGRFALLFIDADGFKQINDEHGHEAGDRVLVALGRRLRATVREQDEVARLGGDEFVLLIEGLRQPADAGRLVRQIEQAVAEPVALSEAPDAVHVVPGISVGMAFYPDEGQTAETLLRCADAAMYEHKRLRRRSRDLRGPMLNGSP